MKSKPIETLTHSDLQLVLTSLDGSRTIGNDGKVLYSGLGFTPIVPILTRLVGLDAHLPESTNNRIITGALFECREPKLTVKEFLAAVARLRNKHSSSASRRFELFTTASTSSWGPLRSASQDGCRIRFISRLSKNYAASRGVLADEIQRHVIYKQPLGFRSILVSVDARTEQEGLEHAMKALNVHRGLVNLFFNRQVPWRIHVSGRQLPINEVTLGPVHTMHFPGGALATETFWYEPDPARDSATTAIADRGHELVEFLRKTRRALGRNPMRAEVEECLEAYCRALDIGDPERAFMRLWSLLERLTGTGLGDTYSITLRRASFIFRDRDFAKAILGVLRKHRNELAHGWRSSQTPPHLVYHLKRFVESILSLLIANRFGFRTVSEASEFMDLPQELELLRRRSELLSFAKEFLRPDKVGK